MSRVLICRGGKSIHVVKSRHPESTKNPELKKLAGYKGLKSRKYYISTLYEKKITTLHLFSFLSTGTIDLDQAVLLHLPNNIYILHGDLVAKATEIMHQQAIWTNVILARGV